MKEEIKNKLRNLVDNKRYEHSLLVAEEAKKLAVNYNLDKDKAYLTGLCHDIAKNFTKEENEHWVNKYNLNKKILDDKYKKMIHADIGAVVVKEWFNFDEEMAKAIKYHTLANRKMTLFEKIIFIADKIGRKDLSPVLKKIKNLAYNDIDQAMVYFIREEEKYLKSKKLDLGIEAKLFLENYKKIDV